MIDFLNLRALNATMQADIETACLRVSRSGRYVLGREVEAFEAEWASYCGVEHCVATGNCLDALLIILAASGIGPDDEVIVAANTYIATWLAVSLVGAIPVPADADKWSMNIDPAITAAAVTNRTRAILPTHLYGLPADMGRLQQIADDYGLLLIADGAQAHGASYRGRRAGSLCHAEACSFYPSKNLGALGDAGCITTNDGELAAKARRLRNYGGVGRTDHTMQGINSRMDEMQAAVLRAKLPYLDAMNAARGSRAARYNELLMGVVQLPPTGGNWHQYVIRSDDRDGLQSRLKARGIDTHIHYPVPPYLEPAYADMGLKRGSFPVAELLAETVLSLPIGYDVDVDRVAEAVIECREEVCA